MVNCELRLFTLQETVSFAVFAVYCIDMTAVGENARVGILNVVAFKGHISAFRPGKGQNLARKLKSTNMDAFKNVGDIGVRARCSGEGSWNRMAVS